ncbi:MAG: hypothetical protein KH366_24425 [Clostridiaceae bacterium]|nr:hypothetical protein [Clostridiaceae bacterium]
MLNEDKIKLMTGIAMFEKREGKKIAPANLYFKSDYVGRHMIRSFFGYTFCSMLILVIWLLYNLEQILNSLNLDELVATGKNLLFLYVGGLVLYLFITFIVYSKKYSYAVRGQKVYVAKLKRLNKRYEFQNKSKELAKEGGRL